MLESFKKVTFATQNSLRMFTDEDMQEYVRDVERVTDTLLQFLQHTVRENIYHLGQHYKGDENDDRSFADKFEKQYQKVARKVLQFDSQDAFEQELEGVYGTMMEYLDRPTSHLLRRLFQMEASRNTASKAYRQLRWCAIIVMLIGLGSFLEYGHCLNKCADALVYYHDRYEIRFSHWGVTVPEFAKLCIRSHRDVEEALGWDDLRDLDRIMQEVSQIARRGAKVCSLTFPTQDVLKHRVGSLSGTKKRVVSAHTENGTTYYTTRRGVKYTMNKDGLLQKA